MYTKLNDHYRAKFGCKIYKLALDGGFTCPNRDGTIDTRGCIFCSEKGSGEFAESVSVNIGEQICRAKERVKNKVKEGKFIAYFQSFTGTYAPAEYLEKIYRGALACEDVVGLAIGTRPDCLDASVLRLLEALNKEVPVYVELGLQSVHPQTVEYIRRGYENCVYFDAVSKLRALGIHVVTHIILGLPGETEEMMLDTVRQAVNAKSDGIKFHLLHVLKGTDLENDYEKGLFRCMTMEEYGSILKKCLAILPDETVVHRITGDGAKRDLVAPLWSGNKKAVLNYLNSVLDT